MSSVRPPNCNICNTNAGTFKLTTVVNADQQTIIQKLQHVVPEVEWSEEYSICEKCLHYTDNFYKFTYQCLQLNDFSSDLASLEVKYDPVDIEQPYTSNAEISTLRVRPDVLDPVNSTCTLTPVNHELVYDGISDHDDEPHCNVNMIDTNTEEAMIENEFYTPNFGSDTRDVKPDSSDLIDSRTASTSDTHWSAYDGIATYPEQNDELQYNLNTVETDTEQATLRNESLTSADKSTVIREESKTFSCQVCEARFTITDIFEHCIHEHSMDVKTVKPYKCETCDARFRTVSMFNRHQKYYAKRYCALTVGKVSNH